MLRPPWTIPKKGFPKANARERALAEWRHIDIREQEGASAKTAKSLAELLPKVVAGMGLDKKRGDLEILKVWNNIIDPRIAAHAQPVNIAKGTLFVNVDHSAWLDEIVRYRRKEILTRLQSAFGAEVIKKISFRIG
jgi:hypothetical protein